MKDPLGPQRHAETGDSLIERIAWLLDRSIRIGPWSIGLDGILGLIPGFGDIAGGAISAVIIAHAFRAGVSRATILRMVANVGIDSLLGAIPFVGDIFDFAFKANVRNLEIYKEALRGQRQPHKDWAFVVVLFLVILALIALPIIGLLYLARIVGPFMPALGAVAGPD